MKNIAKGVVIVIACLALASCESAGVDANGGAGIVGGGILWKDATGRTVGYGDQVSVGYFDADGLLWLVNPRTGQPVQPEVRQREFESLNCSGTPLDTTALAMIPIRYQGRYFVRPINARMFTVTLGSYDHVGEDDCGQRYGSTSVVAVSLLDFEPLPGIPEDAVFTPPIYPVAP